MKKNKQNLIMVMFREGQPHIMNYTFGDNLTEKDFNHIVDKCVNKNPTKIYDYDDKKDRFVTINDIMHISKLTIEEIYVPKKVLKFDTYKKKGEINLIRGHLDCSGEC